MTLLSPDRRALLLGLAAAALPLAGVRAVPLDSFGEPLAVQASALRLHLIRDFDGTLRILRAIGFGEIELVSFPGFAGSTRGDTSALAPLAPRSIAERLARAGLACRSCHFTPAELTADALPRTAEWASAIGVRTMVLAGNELPRGATRDDVRRHADMLTAIGTRVRAAGFALAIHTDHHLWQPVDGRPAADGVLALVAPELVSLQLDFASVVQAGADGADLVARYGSRIHSLHLRDARTPADPNAYLPALPLGEGQVDWRAVLIAARRANIRRYIVEMQLRPLFGVFDACKQSLDYLRALDLG